MTSIWKCITKQGSLVTNFLGDKSRKSLKSAGFESRGFYMKPYGTDDRTCSFTGYAHQHLPAREHAMVLLVVS
jgi:hypothetical protein